MVYLPYQGLFRTCCPLWTGTLSKQKEKEEKEMWGREEQGRRCEVVGVKVKVNKMVKLRVIEE